MEARKEGPEISAGPLPGRGTGKKGLTCGPGCQRCWGSGRAKSAERERGRLAGGPAGVRGASLGATEWWAWRGKRASVALGQVAEAADCWARREGGRVRVTAEGGADMRNRCGSGTEER